MRTWDEAIEAWDYLLNESSGSLVVYGLEFDASRVLKKLDPIAYRCGLLDFIDSMGIDSDDLEGGY